jgi:hypothetical protein
MKWETQRNPQLGNTRKVVKFALWPRTCEDGFTRWLEKVMVVEMYQVTAGCNGDGFPVSYEAWVETLVQGITS